MSIVFIISAPSGSGKSTLVNRLLKDVPGLSFSVSYTTRAPRGNERPDEGYHYITREEFEERISRNEFLEYAEVFGNYYGTHQSVLETARAQGRDLVLDIDVQGGELADPPGDGPGADVGAQLLERRDARAGEPFAEPRTRIEPDHGVSRHFRDRAGRAQP